MAVFKYNWRYFARSVICRNCTEWHFLTVYDTGSKINPSISPGIIECMHHTTFCGNEMLRNVLQFRNTSASLVKFVSEEAMCRAWILPVSAVEYML